jgi:hypothetical protein
MIIVFRAAIPAGDRLVGMESAARFGFTSVGQGITVNNLLLADTNRVPKPINCVMAGNQPLKISKTEIEVNAPNIRFKTVMRRG